MFHHNTGPAPSLVLLSNTSAHDDLQHSGHKKHKNQVKDGFKEGAFHGQDRFEYVVSPLVLWLLLTWHRLNKEAQNKCMFSEHGIEKQLEQKVDPKED
jgi:hypothetical protein